MKTWMLIHVPRWYVCIGRPFVVLAKVAWNNWRFYKRRRMLKTRNGRVYGFRVTRLYSLYYWHFETFDDI